MRPENRSKHWLAFLEERDFTEVITVAKAMQEKGSLTREEIEGLLTPEEHCPMENKLAYILNVMYSLRITDETLSWKGD